MKISTLELIRMMWRWEEWWYINGFLISNGDVIMSALFGLSAYDGGKWGPAWTCNTFTYYLTRPFFYRLVRKLNQRKP